MNVYTNNLHNYYCHQDVMQQAMADEYAVDIGGNGYQARILYGCKISMDDETQEVTIQNTSRGGEWYKPVSYEEEEVFLNKGWRIGVYELSLSNYRIKLDRIEQSIKSEVNGRKNPKQIQSLKNSRENILNRYSKIKSKLNQISNYDKVKNRKHQR